MTFLELYKAVAGTGATAPKMGETWSRFRKKVGRLRITA